MKTSSSRLIEQGPRATSTLPLALNIKMMQLPLTHPHRIKQIC